MLSTPRLKPIKTYDDLSQALDNCASHYDMVRKSDWRNKIQAHRESMRKVWLKTHLFQQQHEVFVAFERELRSNRVSRPGYNRSWKFMDEQGLIDEDCDLEKGILEKHIRAVNAAIISNGLNSTGRPPKNPAGDAPATEKSSATTSKLVSAAGPTAGSPTETKPAALRHQKEEARGLNANKMPAQHTPQSPPTSKSCASKLNHLSASFSHTMGGAESQPAHPAPALQGTRCDTSAASASLQKDRTVSSMDPALTRQTIDELVDSWTAQVSDSVKHIKRCETAGIVSANLCSGVDMTAEAMRQQGTKVRQHIGCKLDPTTRAIANLHHSIDTSSLPQDIKLITEHHIDRIFKKYGTVDLVVISTPCQDLSCANSSGKRLGGTESVPIMQALNVLDTI